MMRSLWGMSIVLVLLLMMTSCATTKIQLPEKYSLDSQLERINKIEDVRLGRIQPGFTEFLEHGEDPLAIIARRDTVTFSESKNQLIKVDEQSFMLRSNSQKYYLLILHSPAFGLMSTDTISLQLQANLIKAGGDFLELEGSRYLIERIYKIESSQQAEAIKAQIVNN